MEKMFTRLLKRLRDRQRRLMRNAAQRDPAMAALQARISARQERRQQALERAQHSLREAELQAPAMLSLLPSESLGLRPLRRPSLLPPPPPAAASTQMKSGAEVAVDGGGLADSEQEDTQAAEGSAPTPAHDVMAPAEPASTAADAVAERGQPQESASSSSSTAAAAAAAAEKHSRVDRTFAELLGAVRHSSAAAAESESAVVLGGPHARALRRASDELRQYEQVRTGAQGPEPATAGWPWLAHAQIRADCSARACAWSLWRCDIMAGCGEGGAAQRDREHARHEARGV
eukprot:COSAG01_NODE_6994_length_3394_cov_1.567404_1_plen_289_part_00